MHKAEAQKLLAVIKEYCTRTLRDTDKINPLEREGAATYVEPRVA